MSDDNIPSEKIEHIGTAVFCDFCNRDFTNDHAPGGVLFGSYALGPCCAPGVEKGPDKKRIKARCPDGKSFRLWVLEDLRQGDHTIRIMTNPKPSDVPENLRWLFGGKK